jgi:hypothetical protein
MARVQQTYDIERAFPSPTHGPTACKIPSAAGTALASQSARRAVRRVSRRDWRRPIWITLKYRGGSEAWWEITFRGETRRYPGHLSLHELGSIVNGCQP